MKTLKKVLAPVMIFAILFAFAACGGNPNAENIIGTWSAKRDKTDYFKSGLSDDFAGFDFSIETTILFKFNGDKTFSLSTDKDALKKDYDKFVDDAMAYYTDAYMAALDVVIEGTGMTREKFEVAYKKQNGSTLEEDVQKDLDGVRNSFSGVYDLDAVAAECDMSGKYKVIGDKLFITGDSEDFGTAYDTIEIVEGKTLKFVSTADDNGVDFPSEFIKVA